MTELFPIGGAVHTSDYRISWWNTCAFSTWLGSHKGVIVSLSCLLLWLSTYLIQMGSAPGIHTSIHEHISTNKMLLYIAHFSRSKASHSAGRLYIGLNPLKVVARKQFSSRFYNHHDRVSVLSDFRAYQ